ncbi:MAG TPA: LysR family transcriptional regulator [Sphingomicrobium sp.]|nr:LysR family transcriptional regulator [Sphingomicrobium sp.]
MHQVRYFIAVCEERSFTRAAKRCGVTQPSLTKAIRRLEGNLGGRLFSRDHRGADLSAFGRVVRPCFYLIERSAIDLMRAARILNGS